MQIIVTFMKGIDKIDFQVNNNMKIRDALAIIKENSELNIAITKFVYSTRKQEQVSTESTFQTAGIYSGDCLKMEEK